LVFEANAENDLTPVETGPVVESVLQEIAEVDEPLTIEDEASRRPLLERITARWNRKDQLEQFIADSPLIEVRLDAETG
jgi:hypothetical protein